MQLVGDAARWMPARDHLAVAEDGLALAKGVLDGLGQPRVADDVVREIDHAAGVDHADRRLRARHAGRCARSASARMIAKLCA